MALVDDSIVVPSLAPLYAGKFPPSAPPPPPPPPPPGLVLANVPSSGTVGAAATGATVTNTSSTSAASWALSSSGGLTISPTLGTLAAGASQAVSLTAAAPGAYSLLLENNSGGSVTGSPVTFTAAAAVATATAFTLTISPSSGTNGIPATVTVTPNAALSAACTVTLSASTGATLGVSTLSFASGATASLSTTVTRATSGSSTVSMSNSLGLTNTGSPRTFTSAGLSVGSQVATLTVYNESGSGTRPFVATVFPLRGVVPSGSTLTDAAGAARATILSQHDDGSAAVVVLAGTASATGTVAVHAATGTDATALGAAAISAQVTSVSVAFGSPYGTASISSFGSPERIWWQNSRTICARYRVSAPTPGTTALEAVIDIQAWADRALVEVVIENGKMATASPTKPTAASYTGATVSINGGGAVVTVNSADMPTEAAHSAFRGWYASGWVGAGSTGLRVTQLHSELQEHPLLYRMDQSATTDMSTYASDAYAPWATGRQRASNMGAGGDHASIGTLTKWQADALQSGDYRAWRAVEANDLVLLGYGIQYRDTTTGLVPTFTQADGRDIAGPDSDWPSTAVNGTMGWEVAHHPSVGLMSFIARPSPVFIELAQKAALWNGLWSAYVGDGTYAPTGSFGPYQMRAKAWGLRTLARAIFLTPDGMAWKTSAQASLAQNVTHLNTYRTDSKALLNLTWIGKPSAPTTEYNVRPLGSAFGTSSMQASWLVTEMHKVASARLLTGADQTAADTMADWLAEWPARWVNEQTDGRWRYFSIGLGMGRDPTTIDSPATWGEMREYSYPSQPGAGATGTWYDGSPYDEAPTVADYVSLNGSSGFGYAGYFWPALVAAVERGVSGAQTAWATVENGISNLDTWRGQFGADGRSGATPRSGLVFASGAGTGTLVGDVWTPARTGGTVNQASWDIVPTGRWVEVAGTRLDTLDAEVQALVPAWNTSTLAWAGVMNAWNGFAIDTAGSRLWLLAAGGHADSSNNGVYRFDCSGMSWAIEKAPSDRSAWSAAYKNLTQTVNGSSLYGGSAGSYTYNREADDQAVAAGSPYGEANGWFYDELYWDRAPTSRHVYSTPVYVAASNELVMLSRRLWKFSLASQTWVYKRREAVAVDGWDNMGIHDEVTNEYLFVGAGEGIYASVSYDLTANTWASGWGAANCPWRLYAVSDCRYGRDVTVFSSPTSNNATYQGIVWKYNLDSRTASPSAQNIQFAGGLSLASFPTDAGTPSAASITFIPSLNEYWVLHVMAGATLQWLKLDPTTTPWTLSPKTFANTAPALANKVMRKTVFMPALNAVITMQTSDTNAYIYKL